MRLLRVVWWSLTRVSRVVVSRSFSVSWFRSGGETVLECSMKTIDIGETLDCCEGIRGGERQRLWREKFTTSV